MRLKNYSGFYRVEKEKWFAGNFEVPDDPPSQLTCDDEQTAQASVHSPVQFRNIREKLCFRILISD